MAIPNGAGGYQYNDGNTGEALLFVQGAPTALTGAATVTAAQLANGLFTFDGTAGAMTLPTVALLEDEISSAANALATVDSLPATSKAVTFVGAASSQYPQNLVYHKDAITFATADLMMPQGVDMASRQVHNGISMRIVRQYDINNDRMPCRIDVLYGYSVIRPQMGVRLWG